MRKYFFLYATIGILSFQNSYGQNTSHVALSDLIKDVQYSKNENQTIQLVWFMPAELWQVILEKNGGLTRGQIEAIVDIMKDYDIFGIVNGKVGPLGGVSFSSRNEILENMSFSDPEGKEFIRLTKSEISADINQVLASMEPMLASMLGDMGKNLQFFVFQNRKLKSRIINPYKSEKFKFTLFETVFNLDFPLASLLPPKICPIDNNEPMKGNWEYCPFHGEKLKIK